MQLRDAVKLIKGAVGRDDGPLSHVVVAGGRAYADDGSIAASCPVMALFEAVVPGKELEAALDRAPDDPQVAVDGERLVVRSRRFKADVATLPMGSVHVLELPAERRQLPDPAGLHSACLAIGGMVEPDQPAPWMSALIVDGERAVAVGARSKVIASLPLRGDHGRLLLPTKAVRFLCDRPAPSAAGATDSMAAFEWPDDSWMVTRLIAANVPAMVDKYLKDASAVGWELTAEWRESFERVAGMAADNELTLTADTMRAKGARAAVEDGSAAPLPAGAEASSRWSIDVLQIVLGMADRVDFAAWPRPSAFSGPNGLVGIMAARS